MLVVVEGLILLALGGMCAYLWNALRTNKPWAWERNLQVTKTERRIGLWITAGLVVVCLLAALSVLT